MMRLKLSSFIAFWDESMSLKQEKDVNKIKHDCEKEEIDQKKVEFLTTAPEKKEQLQNLPKHSLVYSIFCVVKISKS